MCVSVRVYVCVCAWWVVDWLVHCYHRQFDEPFTKLFDRATKRGYMPR